ncbi:MAG: OprO/OprP family phosphate-selective porin [Hyphomicrobium sp.]|nr:OprO/OprP family phosphate-selective porin [Hyphomicrobium sp.]
MHSHRLALLSSSLALALVTAVPAAHAQGANKELLDVLLSNGAITQKQYNQMIGKVEAEAKEKEKEPEVTLDQRGFRVKSADDKYAIKIGGRLHAQAATHLNEGGLESIGVNPTDGTELRRARMEMSGTIQEDWRWAAEVDFADNGSRILDFWLSYTGIEDTALTAGHQKQPYSLSLEMSTNDIAYIERSIDNSLVVPFVDRAIGLRMDTNGENWFFAGGLFGESVGPNDNGQPDGNEGWGAAGRFIYAPVITDNSIVHLGVRGAHRLPADDRQSVRIRTETTNFSNTFVINANVNDLDSVTLLGPEIGLSYGPFTLLGEYNFAEFEREVGSTLDFSSWHVGATWLFGAAPYAKAYRIDAGEFKRPVPLHDFSMHSGGGWGALELGARYASIDMNDGDFTGGSQDNVTVSANWYINNNVRLMFDWTHILETDGLGLNQTQANINREAEGLDILQTRAQWTY